MRLRKVVQIGDKEITIKELTVKELLFLCSQAGWIPSVPEIDLKNEKELPIHELALSFVSDLSKEDACSLAPSEIKTLYDEFLKLNHVVLSLVKYMKLDKVFEEIKESLIKGFMDDYLKTS